MSNLFIALFAYLIDRIFGEFRFMKHPIIYMGEFITYFEEKFYKDSVLRGLYLVIFVITIVSFISVSIEFFLLQLHIFLYVILSSLIASIFIAHKMLKDTVKEIVTTKNKKEKIAMLVSRDTENMNESDIYKAAIETYAENLSDGVLAPLFYLLLFGLPGIIIYKAINTMDSMVGYRNKRYEKYGKVAALLDDVCNYIPSRLTAIFIMIIGKKRPIFSFYENGKKHDSPNAGHPITAMALVLGVKLGGDTSYFGKVKHKANFGNGKELIEADDVTKALSII